jgi:leader peptidase (prepilin peptidase)/N-methyltransferase
MRSYLEVLPEQYPNLISMEAVNAFYSQVTAEAGHLTQWLVSFSLSSIPDLLALLIYLILVPILVFFFLRDRRQLLGSLSHMLPSQRQMMNRIWREVNQQCANYVRGKAVEILIVGGVSYVSFKLLGVPYAALLGLMVGRFPNVVIYRLPAMMERDWRAQCAELEGREPLAEAARRFNLVVPRSRCGHCGAPIKAWQNIPVLSYLWLKGRCAACGTAISPQYPIVELVSGVLSVWVVVHFGLTGAGLAALILTWALIALSVIDLKTTLLPDDITLPLLWLGLLINTGGLFAAGAVDAIVGAAAGYAALWSVYWLFKLATGKEGMGYGDFKLLAMLGAWMGWQALPAIILISSLVGAVVGISLILFAGHKRQIPIPFGPYLAAAGWIQLLYGDAIIAAYLNWLSL